MTYSSPAKRTLHTLICTAQRPFQTETTNCPESHLPLGTPKFSWAEGCPSGNHSPASLDAGCGPDQVLLGRIPSHRSPGILLGGGEGGAWPEGGML